MKKFISVLMVIALVLSLGVFSASAEEETTPHYWIAEEADIDPELLPGTAVGLLGDADRNTSVNVKDATAIQKHVADITNFSDDTLALADVDLSGQVNIKDATAIQKQVAGITYDTLIGNYLYIPYELDSRLFGTWTAATDGAGVINELLPLYFDDPTLAEYINIETFPIKVSYEFKDDYSYIMTPDETTLYSSMETLKADLSFDLRDYFADMIKDAGMNMTPEQMLALMGYGSMREFVDEMLPMEMVEDMLLPSVGYYRTAPDGKIYLDEYSDTYHETYAISGTTMTITGNSENEFPEQYPIIFTKTK